MVFAFIFACKARWPVVAQCAVLGVSRSGTYAWKGRPVARREPEDAELAREIAAAYEAGRRANDRPRVHRDGAPRDDV